MPVLLIHWIGHQGTSVISWTFIFDVPRQEMIAGGIGPAIVDTTYVTLGTLVQLDADRYCHLRLFE